MNESERLAGIAALIGEPARADILLTLAGGQAYTASELAHAASVSRQTASSHLAKLTDGGLLRVLAQGRHRYYRLAGPEIGAVLAALGTLAADRPQPKRPKVRIDGAIRAARTCYGHFAGGLGVALTRAMLTRRYLVPEDADFHLTAAGEVAMARDFGIEIGALHQRRRSFARQCLDWSEREPHLAGALGDAVASSCFTRGWVARGEGRVVRVTERGRAALGERLTVNLSATAS
jgi:DNA-binding transcriptional ArsR family regulator